MRQGRIIRVISSRLAPLLCGLTRFKSLVFLPWVYRGSSTYLYISPQSVATHPLSDSLSSPPSTLSHTSFKIHFIFTWKPFPSSTNLKSFPMLSKASSSIGLPRLLRHIYFLPSWKIPQRTHYNVLSTGGWRSLNHQCHHFYGCILLPWFNELVRKVLMYWPYQLGTGHLFMNIPTSVILR